MTPPTRVKDLFNLPERIHKGDFVLKLADGIASPAETARTYVITPPIAEAFGKALRLVGSALGDNRSHAAYVHGSFGSGKSHFMALLSLLLDANEDAWRLPELHPLRPELPFIGKAKLLQLHFHMVGQSSLEAAIFSRYLEHVREHHPDAPLPGLFADEQLFTDAERSLEELGDERFFGPMNADLPAAEGWGGIAAAARWDRARFESAVASTDTKEREDLFNALVRTRFKAYADESRRFVDLDSGLTVMCRHAASLGYRAVVLFLDELILWLASRASEPAWLHGEAQKMVKLVESQAGHRPIPLVSLVARQRDLAEMVGEEYAGAENLRLRDSLQWWQDRYDTITLEDRNLPAIVEKRVLCPKSDEARAVVDEAFRTMQKGAGGAWQTLLGTQDGEAFRKLYPFSPALVEALVALSNSLQRERTAIKLLMELLVEHCEDLALGEVVRVGDLFDALAGGDDTADGVMKSRFESAKQIYKYQFLPLIRRSNGTAAPDRCQRLRPDHPSRLGCSNCPEQVCRADNRLAKTLLVAALVPEAAALKDLTAGKLAALNHGTFKAPIPGTEAGIVADKLRHWSTEVAQLRVGGQADPTVHLQIEGVDIGPILEQARAYDTPGARQVVLRDLLFEAMGVDREKRLIDQIWRGTKRAGEIVFGNVRTMRPDLLRCPEEHDWRLVVDYPFDEPGFGPNHDIEALDRLREEGQGTWTLVWLPSFLSAAMNRMLGDYVILSRILESKETARGYVSSLSIDNQSRALTDLENLRNSKKARLAAVLEQAYGLADPKEGDLDTGLSIDNHLHVLKPGATVTQTLAPRLSDALERYVPALLEARWPRHPRLAKRLSGGPGAKLSERLLEVFGRIVDAEDKRVPAGRDEVEEARGTLAELGLVRVTENAVHLLEDRMLEPIERRRQQKSSDLPTVGEIGQWADEGGRMGLQAEVRDLIVRAYARWSARTFALHGGPFEPRAGQPIPDEVVLEKPDLPSQSDWAAALDMAGHAFGIALSGRALHADNLRRLERALGESLRELAGACGQLPGLLRQWSALLDVPVDADRFRTADSAGKLCAGLAGKPINDQVAFLAGFRPETSPKALGASIRKAKGTGKILADRLVHGVFSQLRGTKDDLTGAAEALDRAASVLRQDEVVISLAENIQQQAEEGQRLLQPLVPPPPPPPPPKPPSGRTLLSKRWSFGSRREAVEGIASVLEEVKAGIGEGDGPVRVEVKVDVAESEEP